MSGNETGPSDRSSPERLLRRRLGRIDERLFEDVLPSLLFSCVRATTLWFLWFLWLRARLRVSLPTKHLQSSGLLGFGLESLSVKLGLVPTGVSARIYYPDSDQPLRLGCFDISLASLPVLRGIF